VLEKSLELLLPWGPVFFGLLIFAPMLAAVLEAAGVTQVAGTTPLAAAMVLGGAWGLVAKTRGRWL
jgi:hypothetical protein